MVWPANLSNEQVLDTVASYTSDAVSPRLSNEGRRQTGAITASPSADPELWQAILASLEDQGKRQQRQLSRHLSDVAPDVAGQLREQRCQRLRCSPEGVTYFCWEGETNGGSQASSENDGCGSEAGTGAWLRDGARSGQGPSAAAGAAAAVQDCGLVLPSMAGYPPAVREMVLGQLQNDHLQSEAEAEGVINSVPGCTPQLVLSTLGDGNCLSHSCSLGMFGVHDKDGSLRWGPARRARPTASQAFRSRAAASQSGVVRQAQPAGQLFMMAALAPGGGITLPAPPKSPHAYLLPDCAAAGAAGGWAAAEGWRVLGPSSSSEVPGVRVPHCRGTIHATMAHPVAGRRIRARFERQLAASGIPQEAWPAEWERELSSLRTGSAYLSDVHAYVLANVLRRPLLVYGDRQAAEAALAGIYLPSLWPRPREQCCRQPLAILYGWSHFSLLATVQGEGPASPPLLPLCTRDSPLQLRFLSAEEEAQLAAPSSGGGSGSSRGSTEQQLALLRRFMDAERLFNGRLGARLSETPRPNVLVSLLGSLFLRQAAEMVAEEQQQGRR